MWCLRRALPPAFDAHLLTSRRAGFLWIVKCLVFLEDIVLGHKHSASCRCTHVYARNRAHIVSDQTRRFALWTYMVFLQFDSKSICHRVAWRTDAFLLWIRACIVFICIAYSVLGHLSNTLFHRCWFCVWIEVLKSMGIEVIKLLVALPA